MPFLETKGARLYYEAAGEGSEVLVFAHGLFFDNRMWERQMDQFSSRYRCIAFDFRGQGKSKALSGGYDMDTLARDAIELIESLESGPVHFIGLSMGGYVGMRVAARRPDLVRSLILMATSAEPESMLNYPRYYGLVAAALTVGISVLKPTVFPVLFSDAFLRDPNKRAVRRDILKWFGQNRRWGISMSAYSVLSRLSISDELVQISAPTLVLCGEKDVATPPSKSISLARKIKRAELVMISEAGHMINLEVPERVNEEIERFLSELREKQAEELAMKIKLGIVPEPEVPLIAEDTDAVPNETGINIGDPMTESHNVIVGETTATEVSTSQAESASEIVSPTVG
jgi:3-oxoadipate enol-lactonase